MSRSQIKKLQSGHNEGCRRVGMHNAAEFSHCEGNKKLCDINVLCYMILS